MLWKWKCMARWSGGVLIVMLRGQRVGGFTCNYLVSGVSSSKRCISCRARGMGRFVLLPVQAGWNAGGALGAWG